MGRSASTAPEPERAAPLPPSLDPRLEAHLHELRDRTAILTGASYGVGPHIARALAGAGVHLALTARSAEPLERLAAELGSTGVRAVAIPADVTDGGQRDALVARATEALGPIDILVNNASLLDAGRLHTRSAATVRAVLETNLIAPMLLTRRVLGDMLARGRGHVVQVASMAGKIGLPYSSTYTASKHGLVGFSQSLQGELRGTGVQASVVCSGFIAGDGMWARLDRRIHPAFGLSRPERVAHAVLRVLRRGSVEVLVNPLPVRPAIAAWALAPGLARGMFRALGIDAFMRGVAAQVEGRTSADDSRGG